MSDNIEYNTMIRQLASDLTGDLNYCMETMQKVNNKAKRSNQLSNSELKNFCDKLTKLSFFGT
tara:strand:+ start:22 stop:210 length:189 start_codon:yes stop_codon:yes gene_type:complete